MKYFGIDYGVARVGVAISDEDGELAMPLEIIDNIGLESTVDKIAELAQSEQVADLVVGLPLSLEQGQTGNAAVREKVDKFVVALKARGFRVATEDERMTTKLAERLAVRKGQGEDDVAAMLILQGYLDRLNQ